MLVKIHQMQPSGTNNQSRTNLYFYITHSAKSEKNPADLLHPSPIPIKSPPLAYQYHCLALLQWLLRCGLGFLARSGAICDVGIIVIPETSIKPFKRTTVPHSKQRTTASSRNIMK
jgi:hypothetical protein